MNNKRRRGSSTSEVDDEAQAGARTDKVIETPPPVPPIRSAEKQIHCYRHGGSFNMQPHGQCETSVDAGRNETALKRVEPGRVRVRSLSACPTPSGAGSRAASRWTGRRAQRLRLETGAPARRRGRSLAAGLLWAALALSPGFLLCSAAQADVLVKNLNQSADTLITVGKHDTFPTIRNTQTIRFETGGNAGGYTLTSVKAVLNSAQSADGVQVSIYSASGGDPDTSLYVLTNPTSLSDGTRTFTAPANALLAKDTQYFVVFEATDSSRNYKISATDSDTVDSMATGWSMNTERHFKENDGAWSTHSQVPRIQIDGTARIVSTDATLSALALADNNGTAVSLTPSTFVATTTSYTADVANGVTSITLTPTVNDSDATVEYLDASNAAITDTNLSTPALDAPVVLGDNTFKVKVTAEDDNTIETYTVVVTRLRRVTTTPAAPPEVTVPHGWSLIPAGLGAGDKFRLLFLSSTKTNAQSYDIADYNTFIRGLAAAGHTDIQTYSSGFRAVGCTADSDARDNTATTGTGVRIYWLGGNKVADNYADFYDGNWDDEANDLNESGTDAHDTSQAANYPWTGCDHRGTEAVLVGTSLPLGSSIVLVGRPNSSTSGEGPISNGTTGASPAEEHPMYGLSPVFRVPTVPAFPAKVRFGSTGYHAIEGGAEATVAVTMYPWRRETVTIPLTVTNLGGTTAADYQIFVNGSQVSPGSLSVTFSANDIGGSAGGIGKRFTVKALADSANDHRDRVRFGFGSMPFGTTIEGVTDGRAAKTATVWLLEVQDEMMDCSTPDSSAPDLGTLLNTNNPRRLNSKGQIKNSGDCIWFKVPNLANNRSHQFLLTGRWVQGVLSQITSPQIKIYKSDGTPLVQDGSAVEDQVPEADRRFRAPLIRFTPATAGTYYVRASSLGYDVGHFTISYRDIGPGTAPATAAEPLTATLEDIPTNHDGSSAFTFRIAFSAAVEITPEAMRDHALVVSGGTVTNAARVDDRKDLWELTVDPAGTAAVTILVPLDRACTETGALCTADGVMLTTAPGHSVPGPAPVPQGQQALAPLAASFVSVPPEHDGETAFWLELSFNAAVEQGSKPRIQALLGASGGSVTKVRRKDDRLDRWRIQIQPSSHAAVTVTLSPSPPCGATGAVCTEDGRTYTTALATRINGPVGVSVADTTVQEGADAHLDFVVSLSRAAASTVTVNYRTRNGTAIAGQDFTGTSGTVTFAAGETAKTVAVAVLDDVHDEGSETMKLKLANASGGRLTDRKAIGTITNSDPLQRAWLSRFGRTVGTHVTDAVGERLRTPPGQASQVTVGGYRLPLGQQAAGRDPETTDPATTTKPETTTDRLASLLTGLVGQALGLGPAQPEGGGLGADPWADQPGTDPRLGQSQLLQLPTVRLRDVLLGSSFRLALAGDDARDGAMRLTAWGRVAGTRFDGRDGVLSLDGDVFTGTVGIDGTWGRWLLGLAAAQTQADGTFAGDGMSDRGQGTLDNTLTSIHPYVQYAVTDRLNLWGMVGYGWGDTEVTIGHTEILESDTTFLMGAVGGRGVLLAAAETGGFELATRSDAMLTQTSLDDTAGMAGAEGAAHRLRVVLEGSRGFTWPEGRTLTPTLEVGLRHDWGDAETGFGLEVGGRVQYADPRLGLTVDGTVRGLLAHEDNDYKEWGASANVRLAPGMNGQGLSLTLSPTWGAVSSGIDGLWSRQTTAGLAPQGNRAAPTGRLNAEVSYGFTPFGPGLLTPYAGTVLTDGAARTYRLGTRWTSISGLTLNLEGQRQESASQQPVNQGLYLQIGWGF